MPAYTSFESQVVIGTYQIARSRQRDRAARVGGGDASDAAGSLPVFPATAPGALEAAPGGFLGRSDGRISSGLNPSLLRIDTGLDLNLPNISMSISDSNVSSVQLLGRVIRAVHGEKRNAVKNIARRIGRDPRAVKAWMAGDCAPQFDALIDLCADSGEIAAFVQVLIAERRRMFKRQPADRAR